MTESTEAVYNRALSYGVRMTGEIAVPDYHDRVNRDRTYTLAELTKARGRISRLRLLTEQGFPFFDVSYIHGTLPDGTIVVINPRYSQFPRKSLKGSLIAWATEEGVYAKDLGLLDEGNWSILYG